MYDWTDTAEDCRNDDAEIFRCLSCFSFFIPIGDGLFRIFQKRSEAGNVQEAQEVPVPVATENSFLSFFQWKKKPAVLEGSDAPDTTPENKTQQLFDSGMPNDSVPNQNGSVPSAEDTAVPNPLPSVDNVISEPKKVEEGRADSFSQDTVGCRLKPSWKKNSTISNSEGEKFSPHATVAVISFLVFGWVAPVTYEFSFYKSDNRDYKLVATGCCFSSLHFLTRPRESPCEEAPILHEDDTILFNAGSCCFWNFLLSQ
ncbi:uncharacterized protein LOC116203484 isoform X1 [Punica granatum]|uniref:Uncharacterized protein LOC116203484 isoform X1 n=1 Tax=Punica granatum TaxID=22663 RepID=A0A6P8D977_PUNGR|nr:uncharacterized protein LOC116203484 isoform X1 [Punica granatum]